MDLYNSYLRLFIYFPLVLFLIYFILRVLLRRLGPSLHYQSRIQVIERIMISPRVFIMIVKIGDDYLLISSSATGVSLLKDLGPDWPEYSGQVDSNINKNNNFPTHEGLFLFIRNFFLGKKNT